MPDSSDFPALEKFSPVGLTPRWPSIEKLSTDPGVGSLAGYYWCYQIRIHLMPVQQSSGETTGGLKKNAKRIYPRTHNHASRVGLKSNPKEGQRVRTP